MQKPFFSRKKGEKEKNKNKTQKKNTSYLDNLGPKIPHNIPDEWLFACTNVDSLWQQCVQNLPQSLWDMSIAEFHPRLLKCGIREGNAEIYSVNIPCNGSMNQQGLNDHSVSQSPKRKAITKQGLESRSMESSIALPSTIKACVLWVNVFHDVRLASGCCVPLTK